jgi:AcrR family transcriptional regulator
MARTPKITKEQILSAAREVFLEKGFGGSTLEIATRANISEASIFKRFSTKEELFFAAMGIPETPVWVKDLETLSGIGDFQENITQICLEMLKFYREVMPRLMMIRSRGNVIPFGPERASKPMRDLKALATFLEREIEFGRLHPCDPKITAHVLLGSLMNYIFLEHLDTHVSMPTSDPVFVQGLVGILIHGILPRHHSADKACSNTDSHT